MGRGSGEVNTHLGLPLEGHSNPADDWMNHAPVPGIRFVQCPPPGPEPPVHGAGRGAVNTVKPPFSAPS